MIYNRNYKKPSSKNPKSPKKRKNLAPRPPPNCIGIVHDILWTRAAFLFSNGEISITSQGGGKPISEHFEWPEDYRLEGGHLSLKEELSFVLSKPGSAELFRSTTDDPEPEHWEGTLPVPHEQFPGSSPRPQVWIGGAFLHKDSRAYQLPRQYGPMTSWEIQGIHPMLCSKIVLRNPKENRWLLVEVPRGPKRSLVPLASWEKPERIPYVWTRLGGYLDVTGGFYFEFWNGDVVQESDLV